MRDALTLLQAGLGLQARHSGDIGPCVGGAMPTRPRPLARDHAHSHVATPTSPRRAGHAGSCSAGGAGAAAAMCRSAAVLSLSLALLSAAAAAWDLWALRALRCSFTEDCECGFEPDLRG